MKYFGPTHDIHGMRLRSEFVTTVNMPGRKLNVPRRRMLLAARLDDRTLMFHIVTMGDENAQSFARRWRN